MVNKVMGEGRVIWITGLSGAGKTTLAREIVCELRKRNVPVVYLDGDNLRELFGATNPSEKNHGRDARLRLGLQYARLCHVIANQNITVVIATISMFKEVHAWNREHLPGYFEIYMQVPIEELRRRDPKGIYRRFDAGELEYVAGLDLPVDIPESPDMKISWEGETPNQLSVRILENLICEN